MSKTVVMYCRENVLYVEGPFDSWTEAMDYISNAEHGDEFSPAMDNVYMMGSELEVEEVSEDCLYQWRKGCMEHFHEVLARLKSMTNTVRQYLSNEWDGSEDGWWATVSESERVINKAERRSK